MEKKTFKETMEDAVEAVKSEGAKAVKNISEAAEPAISEAMDEVKEAAEKAKAAAEPALQKAKEAAEPALQKAKEAAEPVMKKAKEATEPMVQKAKSAADKAAKKAAPKVSSAEKKLKESGKKIRAALVPDIYIQTAGKEMDIADILERCRQDYRSTHKVGIHSCKVYVKPEENKAYYVINQVAGSIDL